MSNEELQGRRRSSQRRLRAACLAIACLASVGMPAAASATAGSSAGSPVIQTDKGAVQGTTARGVDSYLGIRYAAAPSGTLRWEPPQPAAAWRGVAQTTAYGNRCPQRANSDAPLSLNEDCLFLNVQRPAGTAPGAHLPVFVYIHGGGLAFGSANLFDGSTIVRGTGIIIVTLNYRLGVLGWMGLPALTAERGESGNYGLMDQQAALAWVQRNIAFFGGDRTRVTVGGESAGAFAVCALLASPRSAGLFAQAIMESGKCNESNSQADTETLGVNTAAALACPDPDSYLACLRASDTQSLVNAWDAEGNPNTLTSGTKELPFQPDDAIRQGAIARVPMLIGSNRDEIRTFFVDDPDLTAITDKTGWKAWVVGNFGWRRWTAIGGLYPWPAISDQFTARYLGAAIATDGLFGFGGCVQRDLTQSLSALTTTYAYEFDNRTGPGLRADPVGYIWGAGHAAELPYLWPSYPNGAPINPDRFTLADSQLSAQMLAYWGAFVSHGRPDAVGEPSWPAFGSTSRLLSLRAGETSTLITDQSYSQEHNCGYWG